MQMLLALYASRSVSSSVTFGYHRFYVKYRLSVINSINISRAVYEVTTWEMVYVTVSKLFSSKCREVVGQMLGQNWTAKCMWGINLLLQTTLSHETITI